jgi:transketolase
MEYHEMEMRAVYAHKLNELIEENPDVLCLEADLGKATGTFLVVKEKYPDNFIDCGVQEANMICVGAGLAKEGKIPFCASFTSFVTRRAYDQVTVSVAYANNNVKVIGTWPGITQGPNGATHMCFQDIAIMRVMPNMQVLSPCDPFELRAVMDYMVGIKQPVYMQLIRQKVSPIFDEAYTFDPENAVVLSEGGDVTLVSTGYMTQFTHKSLEDMAKAGITVDLLHYPSVKPFDTETLIRSARKTGAVVTVEDQNIIGGLGGAVCEVLSERCPTRVKRLGVPDKFGEVGTEPYLMEKHGFGPAHIVGACRDFATSK